jgi:hypothetical protein
MQIFLFRFNQLELFSEKEGIFHGMIQKNPIVAEPCANCGNWNRISHWAIRLAQRSRGFFVSEETILWG